MTEDFVLREYSPWTHFTLDEMRCRCGCRTCEMDDAFMSTLDELRSRCGFPFFVNSGYRCSFHNRNVSTTGIDGPHTHGKAADIRVYGTRALKIIEEAMKITFIACAIYLLWMHASLLWLVVNINRAITKITAEDV